MNTLRRLSISRRLGLILVVSMGMLLALGLLMLKQIHDDLYEGKAQKTRHVVQARLLPRSGNFGHIDSNRRPATGTHGDQPTAL